MALPQCSQPLDPSHVDHSTRTAPDSTVNAAIDPTPALAGVRFGGADPSVQRGSNGHPEPFQQTPTTVLEDASGVPDNGACLRPSRLVRKNAQMKGLAASS